MSPSKISVLVLTAVAGATLTAFAVAAPLPPGPGGVFGFFGHHHGAFAGHGGGVLQHAIGELGLTEQQTAQVKGVVEQHRAELKAAHLAIVDARAALRQATLAQPVNESAVRAAAEHVGLAVGDAAVLHARVGAEIRQFLTPDQAARLDALRAEHSRKMAEREDQDAPR